MSEVSEADPDLLEEEELDPLWEEGLPLLPDGGVGGVALGVEGDCGVVGLLALGQPASNAQAQTNSPRRERGRHRSTVDMVRSDNFFSFHGLTALEPGTELRPAQLLHETAGLCIEIGVGIQTHQIDDTALGIDREF